jgi:hypothetical protein
VDRDSVLQRAARWFGIGLVVTPVLDISNDRGILQAMGMLDASMLLEVPWIAWLYLGFFVTVGVAAAWLIARLDARWRQILFWGCSLPLLAYGVSGGLSLSLVAGAVALCFCYVQLRFAAAVG